MGGTPFRDLAVPMDKNSSCLSDVLSLVRSWRDGDKVDAVFDISNAAVAVAVLV